MELLDNNGGKEAKTQKVRRFFFVVVFVRLKPGCGSKMKHRHNLQGHQTVNDVYSAEVRLTFAVKLKLATGAGVQSHSDLQRAGSRPGRPR